MLNTEPTRTSKVAAYFCYYFSYSACYVLFYRFLFVIALQVFNGQSCSIFWQVNSKYKNGQKLSFLDILPKKEEGEINELMGKFFYGCNIPFSVIDSDPFKTFIKKLRPAYAEKMPGRKSLCTTMLDNEYQKQIQRASLIGPESILLIDGWKNTSSNCKTVTTMLHNSTGEQIFLNSWNLSGESETGDRLSAIVDQSIDQAKKHIIQQYMQLYPIMLLQC